MPMVLYRVGLPILHRYLKMSTASDSVIDLGGMRKPYKSKNETFLENDLVAKEPFKQFKEWFDQACQDPKVVEANAMCLATATRNGKPSARIVLLKGYGPDGFRFFTNYLSKKGKDLEENPFAALTFYWESLLRSVRIEGRVEKLPADVAEEYFHSRPLGSQIGACISPQSQPIESRKILADKEDEMLQVYGDGKKPVPKPEHWGGYIVIPESIEFWQGQSTRIHDRIRFRRPADENEPDGVVTHAGENNWIYERLAP